MSNRLETTSCAACFIVFAVPEDMLAAKRKDGTKFYCPSGHSLSFNDNENDRIRRERDRLKQDAARLVQEAAELREEANAAERRAAAARGQVTKIKRRVGNGVCPCCNRSFADLHRHMSTQHPTFTAEAVH